MKRLISLSFLLGISVLLFSQTHYIEVHPNGRVSSLLMTAQEYDSWKTNYDYSNATIREALFQDIYQKFEDDFDFIFLILKETTLPPNMPTGQLMQVSNSVQGIGMNDFNQSADYGSAGKLQSVIHLGRFNYMRYGPSLHELLHNWGNFAITTHALFEFGNNLNSFDFIPHWGFTGGTTKGQLGGFDQNTLVENGGNSYTVGSFGGFANGGNSVPYNDMELYLMGMIPVEQVDNFDVFKSITSQIDNGNGTYTFTAAERETFTPTSIVNQFGQRVPNASISQKDFKALAVVLTDAPLTEQEWNQIDNDILQFSNVGPDNQGSIYNFWEATNQLGTIDFGDLQASVIDTSQQVVLVNSIIVYGQNNATGVNVNQNLQMLANVIPQNATNTQVTWSVINGTGSATINNTGLLSPTSVGTITVKAVAQDGSNTFGQTTITITEEQFILVTSIEVQGQNNASSVDLNQTLQMIANVLPQNATNSQVNWSVDNGTGTATINNTGLLTANTSGNVVVKAQSQDASGVYGTKTITINQGIGISEYDTSMIHIYPNPAKNVIHINATIHNVELFDMLGKQIDNYRIEYAENKTSIYFDGIQAGVYFMNYHPNKTQRFLIE